jgi:hypothetical protein
VIRGTIIRLVSSGSTEQYDNYGSPHGIYDSEINETYGSSGSFIVRGGIAYAAALVHRFRTKSGAVFD